MIREKSTKKNTIIMTTKTICGERLNYVSPALEVLDIKNEGVLCQSGEGTITIGNWQNNGQSIEF